jgi:hypothetical protein
MEVAETLSGLSPLASIGANEAAAPAVGQRLNSGGYMSRERPKEIKKPEPTADAGQSGFLKSLLLRLTQGSSGRTMPAYHPRVAERAAPKHPNDLFAEKRAGKHGGFKDWELNKIWAPKKDKDGGIFLPKSEDSRQQKRARQFAEAYAYMAQHFGGEPRHIRRAMARDKCRIFWKIEKTERQEVGVTK